MTKEITVEATTIAYFVSYRYWTRDNTGQGFGACNIQSVNPLRNFEDLMLVREALLKKNPDAIELVILYWRRYED